MSADDLNIQFMKSELIPDELANANATIAKETVGMSIAEKKAFLKGVTLSAYLHFSVDLHSLDKRTILVNRGFAALIVALHEQTK